MLPIRLDQVRCILCLGAHPADLEIGCGGAVLKLLAAHEGIEVAWVVLSAEGPCKDEAHKGAERILQGASGRRVLVEGFREGSFSGANGEIGEFFQKLRGDAAPDLVFAPWSEDAHPDRRLVCGQARAALPDALVLEYEVPKRDGDLGRPNVYVPLDEPTARRKVHAVVECFRSRHAERRFAADTFWSMLCVRGLECDSPTRMAEGFYCRKMVLG